jgi:hypothetical protein
MNSYLEELRGLTKSIVTSASRNLEVREQQKWLPPPTSVPKINIDAVVSKTGGEVQLQISVERVMVIILGHLRSFSVV